MRQVPEAMAARIESGAASLCHVWLVTRADGVRLGFTDHDRDLSIDVVTCRAASGWTAGTADLPAGLAPGGAAASGALDDAAVTEADIRAGLYDGAAVELWRVDWSEPQLRVQLWRGTISRLVREGGGFIAEMDGPLAALERVVGRTYGRSCDAVLGDERCRVNLDDHPGATCDKRWTTCRESFDNGANFQGFPTLPGDDFLTAYPGEGGRHDGGRRP